MYTIWKNLGRSESPRFISRRANFDQPFGSSFAWLLRGASMVLSAAILICFFMPWIRDIFEIRVSAFDLLKQRGVWKLGLMIPIATVAHLLVEIFWKRKRYLKLLTGVLPLMLLFCVSLTEGAEIIQFLDFGAYLSVALGCVLVLIAMADKLTLPRK